MRRLRPEKEASRETISNYCTKAARMGAPGAVWAFKISGDVLTLAELTRSCEDCRDTEVLSTRSSVCRRDSLEVNFFKWKFPKDNKMP